MRKISSTVARYVGALYDEGTLAGYSDGQLLERLTAASGGEHRQEVELAFAAMLSEWRNGLARFAGRWSLIITMQGRIPGNVSDSDSKSQLRCASATRLVPWLYEVAHRIGNGRTRRCCARRAIERRELE